MNTISYLSPDGTLRRAPVHYLPTDRPLADAWDVSLRIESFWRTLALLLSRPVPVSRSLVACPTRALVVIR